MNIVAGDPMSVGSVTVARPDDVRNLRGVASAEP